MEILNCNNRVIDMSEPILAEDSTFSMVSLSLHVVLEQFDKEETTHHDYLVALLLVLLAESGFYALPSSDPADKSSTLEDLKKKSKAKYWNTRLVCIPTKWKSKNSDLYEIYFLLLRSGIQSKLIAKPIGDKLILNMYPCIENKRIYSMIVKTLMYVNPHTNRLNNRYRNLKDISHRFKDNIVTPVRTDIFYSVRLTNPSLQGLPLELLMKIKKILNKKDIKNLTAALRKF